MSITKIGPKHQITIPNEIFRDLGLEVGDYIEATVDGNAIRLVPKKLIPKDQAWFWTKEWQEGERKAQEDIAEGRLSGPFNTPEDLLRHLHRK